MALTFPRGEEGAFLSGMWGSGNLRYILVFQAERWRCPAGAGFPASFA